MINKSLLSFLVCPLCKGALNYYQPSGTTSAVLICKFDKLAYSIEEDIPNMIPEQAKPVSEEELSHV
jgi:uncharacterized protein YbaR (Trm112 family)